MLLLGFTEPISQSTPLYDQRKSKCAERDVDFPACHTINDFCDLGLVRVFSNDLDSSAGLDVRFPLRSGLLPEEPYSLIRIMARRLDGGFMDDKKTATQVPQHDTQHPNSQNQDPKHQEAMKHPVNQDPKHQDQKQHDPAYD